MAMIPLAPPFELAGQTMHVAIADSSVGVLLVLALSSLTVYGIAIGGWSSTSKYSLLGGLRSSAQMQASFRTPSGRCSRSLRRRMRMVQGSRPRLRLTLRTLLRRHSR